MPTANHRLPSMGHQKESATASTSETQNTWEIAPPQRPGGWARPDGSLMAEKRYISRDCPLVSSVFSEFIFCVSFLLFIYMAELGLRAHPVFLVACGIFSCSTW